MLTALLLTPWPVAYAYDDALGGNSPVRVEAAESAVSPKLNAFGNAIGGVTPGDLFYVNNSNITTDTPFTLHITNVDELIHYYRYMTLNIGVYFQNDTGQWEAVADENGSDTYITMFNGRVDFILPGYARYKITIDRGCFYCYGTRAGNSIVMPKFYLTMN